MTLTATPLYAGLLALLFLVLSVRIVRRRQALRASLGTAGDAELERRVRAHGNCAEYAPFGLLLLALVEGQGLGTGLVHLGGATLLAGRIVHAWALSALPAPGLARVAGMALTFAQIGACALAAIALALV